MYRRIDVQIKGSFWLRTDLFNWIASCPWSYIFPASSSLLPLGSPHCLCACLFASLHIFLTLCRFAYLIAHLPFCVSACLTFILLLRLPQRVRIRISACPPVLVPVYYLSLPSLLSRCVHRSLSLSPPSHSLFVCLFVSLSLSIYIFIFIYTVNL